MANPADIQKLYSQLDEQGQTELLESLNDDELKSLHASLSTSTKAPDTRNPIARTIENIPSSAVNVASGIANAVSHPLQTVGGLVDLGAGVLQKAAYAAVPDSWKPDQDNFFYSKRADDTANAVGQFYGERYGSLSKAGDTIMDDPVGFLGDAATVLGFGGGGLRAAGLSNAANKVQAVGRAIDPIAATAKAATAVASPAYKAVIGTTTGQGMIPVEKGLEGGQAFIDQMRGKARESEPVEMARDSLHEIAESRRFDYQSRLTGLKGSTLKLPMGDVKALSDQLLKNFNVSVNNKGGLNFKYSKLRTHPGAMEEVKNVHSAVEDWNKKGSLTLVELDDLKQTISGAYTSSSMSRSMVKALEKAVDRKIKQVAPEYAEMTTEYKKSTDLIKEMERALSLGERSAADTALRKLMVAVKEDKNFRRDLIAQLDKHGGTDVMGSAAGAAMQPWTSRSLGASTTAISSGAAAIASNPWYAGLLALASPRIAGEASVLFGRIGRGAKKARPAGLAAYQTGRLPLMQDQQ